MRILIHLQMVPQNLEQRPYVDADSVRPVLLENSYRGTDSASVCR